MALSEEMMGADHPSTTTPTPARKKPRLPLSGEMFGDDPSKGFNAPEPLRVTFDPPDL